MKVNKLYLHQQRAARCLADVADRYKFAVVAAEVAVSLYSAYFVFMNA